MLPEGVLGLVRRLFGREVSIGAVEFPGAWAVARLRLEHAPMASVVVKWLRSDPGGWRTDPRQQFTEAAALRYLHTLCPGLVPQVLGSEFDHPLEKTTRDGILILEDLDPRISLYAAIRQLGVDKTEQARRSFLMAGARLITATVGREPEVRKLLGDNASIDPEHGRVRPLGKPWPRMRAMIEGFGVSVSPAADAEYQRLYAYFAEPGAFLTLSNGDMATNNYLVDPADQTDGRLIDFEFAHCDHALTHVAGLYVPGPPWMVINDPIAAELEEDFRTALATTIGAAGDDRIFHRGVAAGCVAMGFERCGNLPKMDARPAGDASRAQRVYTLETAARVADARGYWPALAALQYDLAQALRRRWPEVTADPRSLPPYTPRT